MKISKFLKDIISTGFNQVVVLLLGIILLKEIAGGLGKVEFGIFMVIRRWVPVLVPLLILNLNIGLVKYVSAEKESARMYLGVALIISLFLMGGMLIALLFFHDLFSFLLFNSKDYSLMAFFVALFVFANMIHLIVYSYFRGQMEITRANMVRLWFYGFPVVLGLIVYLYRDSFSRLHWLYFFFVAYSVLGLVSALLYLRGEMSLQFLKELFWGGKEVWQQTLLHCQSYFIYSLARIPTVIFNALIFGLPAMFAVHYIDLVAAGYLGIVVAVIRLLEVSAMPFNMIFLPKFSALKEEGKDADIQRYCQVVVNFIITFLPVMVVMVYGLSRFIITAWFNSSYVTTGNVHSVSLAVLFAIFYLIFALLRGILDGLYIFPYNNFISLAGVLAILAVAFIWHHTVFQLAMAFNAGQLMLGVMSMVLLLRKLKMPMPWKTLALSLTLNLLLAAGLIYSDMWVSGLKLSGLQTSALLVLYRFLMVLAIWWFYWRQNLWYREVKARLLHPGKLATAK